MKLFEKLRVVDKVDLTRNAWDRLEEFSQESVTIFDTSPKDTEDLIERIGDADGLLISWSTPVPEEVIVEARNLKYIGICGTSMKNIDVNAAEAAGIHITNVTDYGDEDTVEWIFMRLLMLARGEVDHMWRDKPAELFSKTIGIIGAGAVGTEMIRVAKGFGMRVLYYSRTRKPELEDDQVSYVILKNLLQESEIVSLHIPKGVEILDQQAFEDIRATILVDTSHGEVMSIEGFRKWITKGGNYAIFDRSDTEMYYDQFHDFDRVFFGKGQAGGASAESLERKSLKVIKNITKYLNR